MRPREASDKAKAKASEPGRSSGKARARKRGKAPGVQNTPAGRETCLTHSFHLGGGELRVLKCQKPAAVGKRPRRAPPEPNRLPAPFPSLSH